MSDRLSYEVVVVGGGPAGTTTALYTTRLGHRTAVFEAPGGRHASVSHVHNVFGVSEDVSGRELSRHAVDQFEEYGGAYFLDAVEDIRRTDDGFVVEAGHATVDADRVVFATGFSDVDPPVPELVEFTGRGLHYCLHCDAYTLGDGRVFVLGHDDHAASVAMLMLNFTADVDLLLDGHDPEWSEDTDRQVRAHPVDVVETPVAGAFPRDERAADQGEAAEWRAESEATRDRATNPWLGGLTFAGEGDADETTDREYLGGFAMYGKEYNTDLAESLGCALADDGALVVDETYETSVEGAYAAGDITHGQNQTVVAMGDGAKAGMALHKDLRRYPLPPDELDDVEPSNVPAAAADLRARMRLVRNHERHAGLREPPPDR
ncbi:NAD(P)/FAD-dependent oxidoreductase [Halobacterium wangiae]|uniref:NAD(P)/FAD-dependent oxidoreductase n=1 Tax=Halobacterium wangiae TaxID=2902623 RepID=UPI001E59310A|nr:NAD(P)/FAD-dependent oxidoreductase [Halobacterium wangiae]